MTDRRVAFLRAINVGGRRIKMAKLRELLSADGYENPRTHGASGNVVFDSDAKCTELERELADDLAAALGYDVIVFVRTFDELADIAGTTAFEREAARPRTRRYVSLLKAPLDDDQRAALAELNGEVDQFSCVGTEIFWFRQMDAGESLTNMALEKALGVDATRRTLDTVKKIVAKYA